MSAFPKRPDPKTPKGKASSQFPANRSAEKNPGTRTRIELRGWELSVVPHVRFTPRVNNDGLEVAATDSSVFLQWSRVVLFWGQTVNNGPRFLKGCQRSRDLGPVIYRSMGCLVGEMKTSVARTK